MYATIIRRSNIRHFWPACFLVEINNYQSRFNANFDQMITFSMFHSNSADKIRAHTQLSTRKFRTNADVKSKEY